MRYLNTVYVMGHEARVSRSKGSVIVATPNAKERIPMHGIDGIVILGGAQATTDLLAACAENGIRVACLRRNGSVRFTVGLPRSGNVHLRIAQMKAATDAGRSLALARLLVASKLQNSRRVILRWARDGSPDLEARLSVRSDLIAERLGRLSTASSADVVRGIEGDAARAHFAAMGAVLADGPFPFTARQRRPPRDPVNAALGFCYGLLVTEVSGAVEAVGLDQQIGFFHRARSGRPSLALDLVEEFRPMADRFVVTLLRRHEIGTDGFTTTPGGGCYLSDAGRSAVLRAWERAKAQPVQHQVLGRAVDRWTLPSVQATLLARHLRGDLPVYPPYVMAS